MRIGVDLMGSESSPQVLFEAVLQSATELSAEDSIVVYLTVPASQLILSEHPALKGRVSSLEDESRFSSFLELPRSQVDLCFVSESIEMADDPLSAIRLKRKSSLVVGIAQLEEKKIDAFVSAGNTGALIACAALSLPRIPGMDRTCLLALLPTQEEPLALIDVGGFLSSEARFLVQYAKLGAAYQRCIRGKRVPTVALLNVGVESKKGTKGVREAFSMLQQESEKPNPTFQFLGNVEGREVFRGKVDVLVTDGFTGNVMLKTSEGVSAFIFEYLQAALRKAGSPEMHTLFDQLQRHFSYDEYPGALVCGVDGLIVKCHGAASVRGMMHSIRNAARLVKNKLLDKVKEDIDSFHLKGPLSD